MAAGNVVLRNLKKANDPEQQHKNGKAVSRVAKPERGANGLKGRKPLQADRSRGDGLKLNGCKGEERNS
jgi:hypothetical protein